MARIEEMEMLNDARKKSFLQVIKSESTVNTLSEKSSSFNTMMAERKRENVLLASTTMLNSKVNQLNALASIHATNVQRQLSGSMSEAQMLRMEKNEAKMDALNDEIEAMNRDMQSQLAENKDDGVCNGPDAMYKTPTNCGPLHQLTGAITADSAPHGLDLALTTSSTPDLDSALTTSALTTSSSSTGSLGLA
jgi:hypothetical protein